MGVRSPCGYLHCFYRTGTKGRVSWSCLNFLLLPNSFPLLSALGLNPAALLILLSCRRQEL